MNEDSSEEPWIEAEHYWQDIVSESLWEGTEIPGRRLDRALCLQVEGIRPRLRYEPKVSHRTVAMNQKHYFGAATGIGISRLESKRHLPDDVVEVPREWKIDSLRLDSRYIGSGSSRRTPARSWRWRFRRCRRRRFRWC